MVVSWLSVGLLVTSGDDGSPLLLPTVADFVPPPGVAGVRAVSRFVPVTELDAVATSSACKSPVELLESTAVRNVRFLRRLCSFLAVSTRSPRSLLFSRVVTSSFESSSALECLVRSNEDACKRTRALFSIFGSSRLCDVVLSELDG